MFRIQLTHADSSITFTRTQYSHEVADRLAKQCTRDTSIKAAVAVSVAACDCRSEEEQELLCIQPYNRAA